MTLAMVLFREWRVLVAQLHTSNTVTELGRLATRRSMDLLSSNSSINTRKHRVA